MEAPPAYDAAEGYAGATRRTVLVPVHYGSKPVPLTCPYCNAHVTTELTHKAGGLTYLVAFGVALFFWCGCCLIPCYMDGLKDVYHCCPSCKIQLGTYKRL